MQEEKGVDDEERLVREEAETDKIEQVNQVYFK